MSRVALMLSCVLSLPLAAEAQQVYRDKAAFLAAVGEVTFQGFESYPHQPDCSAGGSNPVTFFATPSFTITQTPLDGGTSFLCIGTAGAYDPSPTEGINALIAGSISPRMANTIEVVTREMQLATNSRDLFMGVSSRSGEACGGGRGSGRGWVVGRVSGSGGGVAGG